MYYKYLPIITLAFALFMVSCQQKETSVDQIDTKKQFRRWRTSFLQHLETFVDEEHCEPAQAEYAVFTGRMTRLSKLVKKLYGHLEAGHVS